MFMFVGVPQNEAAVSQTRPGAGSPTPTGLHVQASPGSLQPTPA